MKNKRKKKRINNKLIIKIKIKKTINQKTVNLEVILMMTGISMIMIYSFKTKKMIKRNQKSKTQLQK